MALILRLIKKEDGAVIITGLVLLIFFTLPGNVVDEVRPKEGVFALLLSDWASHLSGLALFTLVLAWDMRKKGKNPFPYFFVAGIALGYGFFIEIIQVFIPFRSFDLRDLFWDAVGITIVLAGIYIFKERRSRPGVKK